MSGSGVPCPNPETSGGQETTVLPFSVAADARTGAGADVEEQDGRPALRRDLAAIIAHPKMPADERRYIEGDGCDRCPKALDAADAVIAAGFRRVVEDEAVARVEAVLTDWVDGNGPQAFWTTEDAARAAVRAIREAGNQ